MSQQGQAPRWFCGSRPFCALAVGLIVAECFLFFAYLAHLGAQTNTHAKEDELRAALRSASGREAALVARLRATKAALQNLRSGAAAAATAASSDEEGGEEGDDKVEGEEVRRQAQLDMLRSWESSDEQQAGGAAAETEEDSDRPAGPRGAGGPKAKITHANWGECGGRPPRGLKQPECRKVWDEVPHPKLIVEFGGNVGDDLQAFAERYPEAIVHSFEPVGKFHKRLVELFPQSGSPRVVVHPFGASNEDVKVRFRTDGDQAGTSQFGHVGDDASPVWEEVQLRDAHELLDQIVRTTGREVDVLSINCEGCEYAILERLSSKGWLTRLKLLQISWHSSAEMPNRLKRRCDLVKALRGVFRPGYLSDFGWDSWTAVERPYAVDTRYIGEMPTTEVGRGNGIPQAQSGVYCAQPDAVPEGAERLEPELDPEVAHLTYPQTKRGDLVQDILGGAVFRLPPLEPDDPPHIIVEVGAGTGAGVRFKAVLGRNPRSTVHSFEPSRSLAAGLQREAAALNATGAIRVVWPVGWSSSNARARLRVWGAGPPLGPPGPPGGPGLWVGREEEAELWDADRALAEVAAREQGRGPALLYLNCEGCEYDVLLRLGASGRLRTIPRIAVSWHAGGAPWRRRCEVDALLRKSHRLQTGVYSYELWVVAT